MSKSKIAFVAGSIAVGLFIFVVPGLKDSSDEPTTAGVAPAKINPVNGRTDVVESRVGARTPTSATSTTGEPISAREGPQATAAAGPSVSSADNEVIGASLPIPVASAELAAHLKDPRVARLHAEIEGEPLDASWATTTENQITSFYAGEPAIIAEYGMPSVYCRSTLCEIQVVAYGADARNWLNLNRALFDQPWSEFKDGPVGYGVASTRQGDAVVITQWLKRKDATTQALGLVSAAI